MESPAPRFIPRSETTPDSVRLVRHLFALSVSSFAASCCKSPEPEIEARREVSQVEIPRAGETPLALLISLERSSLGYKSSGSSSRQSRVSASVRVLHPPLALNSSSQRAQPHRRPATASSETPCAPLSSGNIAAGTSGSSPRGGAMSTPSHISDASPTSHTLNSMVSLSVGEPPRFPQHHCLGTVTDSTSLSVGNLLCGDCKAKNQPPVAWEAMIKRHNKRAVASV